MSDLIKRQKDEIIYFESPQLASIPQIKHAFFTRYGGVSSGDFESLNLRLSCDDDKNKVLENFSIAASFVGGSSEKIARTYQRHTDNIMSVTEGHGPESVPDPEGVDAIMTDRRDVVLTVFYADCQPILLYDRKQSIIAAIHAGWRGIIKELPHKTLEKMREVYGTDPADIIAAIGPSICRGCFETDDDVPEATLSVYGERVREYVYRKGSKWHVDLKNITYISLIESGVMPYNIDFSNSCTKCNGEELFWSHRKHGEARGVQGAMIRLK